MFNAWGKVLEGYFNCLLDIISVRLCYGCKKAHASPINKYYCNYCFNNLKINWLNKNYSRKYLDFSYTELTEFYDTSIPLYPKIYFATEYGSLTKSLIRHFKYRKPYISEFWSSFLAGYWKLHADWILSDLSKDEVEKFNPSERSNTRLKFWVTYVPMNVTKLQSRIYNQAELIAREFTQLLNKELKKSPTKYLYQSSEGLAYIPVSAYELLPNFITRIKNTESLYDKSKQERLAILHGAFSINALEETVVSQSLFEKLPDARHASSENAELTKSSMSSSRNEHNNADGTFRIGSENILIVIDDISTTGATAMEIYRSLNLEQNSFWKEVIFLALTGRNFK